MRVLCFLEKQKGNYINELVCELKAIYSKAYSLFISEDLI